MREPEPDVVRRARGGDADAFEELVRMLLPDAYRLACRLLGDTDSAQDVTQDAFLEVWRSLPRFRGDAKVSTWVFRIVRNCAVDAIRRASQLRKLQLPPAPAVQDPSMRAALHDAVGALPPELREAFVVIEVFGFTYPEASVIVGAPTGTLKSRMHRARRRLMDALEGCAEDVREV